jgi:hypothetical protein
VTDIFQVAPLRASSCLFIEIDWNFELVSDALSQTAGNGHTILHRHAGYRHKGDNIRSADAWVLSGMLIQVDPFSRFGNCPKSGFFDLRWRSNEGQDSPVVIQVGVPVEQNDLGNRANGLDDMLDNLWAASFGKICDTLNNGSGHYNLDEFRLISQQLYSVLK